MKVLEDILILDFSQFLSAPSASLRLADLGARVIKIEKPGVGDIGRYLYVNDAEVDGISTIFHSINRNKESFQVDLKSKEGIIQAKKLIKKADVLIHNFRPGVMEKIGISYEKAKEINPQLIYATVNGYSDLGEWKNSPGQDLLLQAVSGISWLSGNAKDGPVPMGISVADILAGTHLTQGILAALYDRINTGKGALVEVSMLESLVDFQFELFTSYLNDGNQLPMRSESNNGNAYIAAPYGIYETRDGYVALAMGSVSLLGDLLNCPELEVYDNPTDWFIKRDDIKKIIQKDLKSKKTQEIMDVLEPADFWCSQVLDYPSLVMEDGYRALDMEQEVLLSTGKSLRTTRCPIRIDGKLLKSSKGAPFLGEDNNHIKREFDL